MLFVIYLLSIALIVVVNGELELELTRVFDDSDQQRCEALAHRKWNEFRSFEDRFHAIHVLKRFQSHSNVCSCVDVGDLTGLVPKNIYFLGGILDVCGCHKGDIFSNQDNAKKEVMDGAKSENFEEFAYALLAAKTIGFDIPNVDSLLPRFKDYLDPVGLFRSEIGSRPTSTSNTKLALLAMAAFSATVPAKLLEETVELSSKLLPSGHADDGTTTDPTLLWFINLASGKKSKTVSSRVTPVTSTLLDRIYDDDIATVDDALRSLDVTLEYKTSPLYINIEPAELLVSAVDAIQLDAIDAIGQRPSLGTITSATFKVLEQGFETAATNLDASKLQFDLSSRKWVPGRYEADIVVQILDRPKPVAVRRSFRVLAPPVTLGDISYFVGPSAESKGNMRQIASNSNREYLGFVEGNNTIRIEVLTTTTAPLSTITALVSFENDASKHTVTFEVSGTKQSKPRGYLFAREFVINSTEIQRKFDYSSGLYHVSIIIAGELVSPTHSEIGNVDIGFVPKPKAKHLPLYKQSLLHTSDTTLVPLPEIEHLMRPPAARASTPTAFAFSCFVVLATVVFIGYALSIGANLKGLQNPGDLFFVSSLFAVCGFSIWYWVGIPNASLYDVTRIAAILITTCLVFGQSVVRGTKSIN